MVQMKIKISSLLMEAGVSYNTKSGCKTGYFRELLATNPDIDEGLRKPKALCPLHGQSGVLTRPMLSDSAWTL